MHRIKPAAREAAAKTIDNARRSSLALLAALVLISAAPAVYQIIEASRPVYGDISSVQWRLTGRSLVFTGTARKLRNCYAIPGREITLSAAWRDASGRNVRAFPALRTGGDAVISRPLAAAGDEFVIGPWVIEAAPDLLAKVDEVSVWIDCRMPSGKERTARIGPIWLR